ncbi:MAG: hypothetical protein K0V04_20760, partial [Deltaproteobacteria bacterium]|nr:hypothetical protein [Deltaproteobacteria bacterium]
MAEANEAEPNESTAPSPRRPRRKHQINLCCAQSVQVIVEEVSRNLRGLGFRVSVVCGAEARAALLGSQANSDEPTIHVVCVQGSLQERVLKPLRQALATHGGPNQHLFVAVLDLGVPLAMVGQIRRFAEALERPTTTSSVKPDGTVERRAWREHSGQLDRPPARSLPSVMQVVERPGTVPPQPQEGSPRPRRRTRTKTLTSRGRAVKIGPTSKYQAVTASHPAVPTAEPGVNKRRRERSAANPQRRPTGSNPRVLDLPDSEASRPPPVPTPSELARRRSGTLPAVTPGAPPVRRRPDSTAPGFEQAVTQAHKPWRPAAAESVPERDAATPRGPGIRFTPPGVSAAKGTRTPSGRFIPVPTAGDPDKTVVQGLVDQTPKTASTLRLDEPPFKAERSDKTTLYNNGPVTSDGEPVEPTVIEPPPTGPRATKSKKTAAELSSHADPLPPAVTGHTVVGPPPEPPPEVLAELERARQQAKSTSDTQSDEDAITVPPAGATVKDEDADARADDDDDEGDEPKAPGPPPSSTTTLPGESNPTAPNSDDGTLVVPAPGDPSASASGTVQSLAGGDGSGARVSKPRQTVLYVERAMARDEAEAAEAEAGSDAAPAAVAAAAVGAAAVAKAAKASSAASKSTGKTTTPEASESTPTLLSRPRPAASEDDRSNEDISESDKTLLRADGTFEDASALMKKVEAAQAATRAAGEDGPARIVVDLDPEDRHDDAADGSSKTVVFNRGDDETSAKDDDETRDSGGTVVAAAAAIAAESARRVTGKDPDDKADAGQDDSAAAASGSSKTEPASGKTEPSKTKAASSTAGSSKTESSKTEAASSTAGSSKSEPSKTEPSGNTVVAAAPGGSTETRAKRSRKGRGRNNGRGAPRTGRRRPPSTPTDKPRTKTAVAASKPAPTPIAEPESSRRGWVWLLILLLVGGGVWLAYER